MDRSELAAFLRSRRERILPSDVGLPAGPRRRTPGLRREEVAHLAYISTEYYTRLEQARAPRPSREVLSGLTRALRLSDAERDHLYHLAGETPGLPPGPSREVRPSLLRMVRRLPGAVVLVLSATYEVIAWNDLAAALLGDFSALAPRDRNLVRWVFLGPPPQRTGAMLTESGAEEFAVTAAMQLRATAARYPHDPEVRRLVDDLCAGSPEFARLWASHEVVAAPLLCKTFVHPMVGRIDVHCDGLDVTARDQKVLIYTPEPDSPSEEAFRLLSVIGTQRVDVPG